MSSIFIEIGQCGCQIGDKLNPKLSSNYYCCRTKPPHKLHCIMVDTEPKVLRPYLEKAPKWLDPSNIKYFQYGRGNNWSYGYLHCLPKKYSPKTYMEGHKQFSHNSGEQQGELSEFEECVLVNKYIKQNKQICQYVVDRTRQELQSCDCLSAINVICSLGGGTGSGLGTKIIELINEQFCVDLYAHVVLPNKSGETPLQIYNCALSLASIQEHATAIFPYENDNMISMYLTASNNHDLETINEGISSSMANMISLNDNQTANIFYHMKVAECILSKELNYVSLLSTGGNSFDQAFDSLYTQLRAYNEELFCGEEGVDSKRERCLASSLITLGKQPPENQPYRKKLKHLTNPIEYNFNHSHEHFQQQKQNQLILLMNHTNIVRYLNYVCKSGRKKYDAKAYLWHYQYADIEQAFSKLDCVIDQYMLF